MRNSNFNFDLPEKLIAQYPIKERDESRLMVINRKKKTIENLIFKDIVDFFEEDDVLVINNTKIFPGKLIGEKEKTSAEIEVILTRELSSQDKLMDAIVEPARKVRIGNKIYFGDPKNPILEAEITDNTTSRGRTLKFSSNEDYNNFKEILKKLGKIPLPKYIQREIKEIDNERYQTIYASKEGAIGAPSAGFHFSKHILKKLEIKGVNVAEVTLHIGLDSGIPVGVEDLSKHKMDSEYFFVSQKTCNLINDSIKKKKQICVVGASSMKAIESATIIGGKIYPRTFSEQKEQESRNWSEKFIFPPYHFEIASRLLTNFHTPKSTLLMLASAFCGHDLIMKAYKQAIDEKYRFCAYGDAMLII
jgi:S-adenosylmethionine:tRNA ribosyltransferase-isomerase